VRSLFAVCQPLRSGVNRARLALGLLVLSALVALGGCTSQYPQTILDTYSSDYGPTVLNLFILIFWPALIVFVLVEGALLYTIIRYRQRPGHGRPEQVHGTTRIVVAWTIAPALVLAFIAVPTVRDIFVTQAQAAPGSLEIHVTGHQWWWEYEYPEYGITVANEFAAPTGRTVNFSETSADVIHSFWVPAMGGKRDVVPNHTNHFWFTPAREGLFLGQCAEYCGDAHADMRLRMWSLSPDAFQRWVDLQKSPATPQLNGIVGP
jgi:cytochrome c oxidase subunit 2